MASDERLQDEVFGEAVHWLILISYSLMKSRYLMDTVCPFFTLCYYLTGIIGEVALL